MRIQAALVESPGGPFTIQDLDLDAPRPDEVLVRITAAGICHTDLSMRQIWPQERLPMVFGHEGAGFVEAVGDAVTTIVPGDAVCLTYRSCSSCEQCTTGGPAYCEHAGALNVSGSRPDGSTPLSRPDGTPVYGSFFGQSAFATHCLTYESNTIKVPAELPPIVAAPLGCSVQTGVGTVRNVLRPSPGTALAVFGAGSVGLSAVMAAVAEGCTVVAVDPIAHPCPASSTRSYLAGLQPCGPIIRLSSLHPASSRLLTGPGHRDPLRRRSPARCAGCPPSTSRPWGHCGAHGRPARCRC